MKQLNRKISVRASMTILVITILLVSATVTFADSNFAVPNTFTPGTTISSSEVNANFQAIGQQLSYSKTISFGPTTITSSSQNLSSVLSVVTPTVDGYLIVFQRDTASLPTDVIASISIANSNSSGTITNDLTNHLIVSSETNHNMSYQYGFVAAGTTLYFVTKVVNTAGDGGTIEGSLSALFIPAPNQLP